MITTNRLFLVPALSMFLLLIPVIGIFLTFIVCALWYTRNQKKIHLYFRGFVYEQNETSDSELEKMK